MAEPMDPTGTLIVETRLAQDVLDALAAMNGGDSNPKRITGNRDDMLPPPGIIIEKMPENHLPFGPGSGRIGVKTVTYAIKCSAKRGRTGDIEATHLANVVAHFLHLRGPRTRAVAGGKVGIFISRVMNTTQVLEDPVSKDPYVVVNASVEAAAQAVP